MKNPFIGSWETVKITHQGMDRENVLDTALPGLFLFTKTFYSMVWMPGSKRQENYKDLWCPNDEEKVASYNSIVVNAGRYVFSSSMLTTFPEVAKKPAFIGGSAVYDYEFNGEELKLKVVDAVSGGGVRDTEYLKLQPYIYLHRVE